MDNWLNRTELLIGKNNIEKLKNSSVAVFGCGGVGSYVIEALARCGIGNLTIIDKDIVDITNINRQLIADTTTIGLSKVETTKQRLLKINPKLIVNTFEVFYDDSSSESIFSTNYDYIVDAIDTVSSKLLLIEEATLRNIPIISCMGTGNKLDPKQFEITDISKTSVCPLAKVIRKELAKKRIKNVKVLYSKEKPRHYNESEKRITASISFVPSVAGLLIASEVISDLIF